MDALNETVGHVKTQLMPDYNFDEFKKPSDENESNDDFGFDSEN
jgi:hypothetical protein